MKRAFSLVAFAATAFASGLSAQTVDLNGAGATFPYPIYARWFADYAKATGVHINYTPIGSGGGIQQLSAETVDFGATDGPMTDDEMAKAKGGRVLHVPTVIGAVAIAYNVPEAKAPIRLDGRTIALIYMGKVSKWNDPRIAELNPGVTLPAKTILVVHRSEGSGTTFIFTDFLASQSKEWLAGPGRGKDVAWPVGLGGKGNEGVTAQVKQVPYSIGYVELAYAKLNNLGTAVIKNAAGQFVGPSVESATAAAASKTAGLSPKSDYRLSIVNAPGAQSYPIASFTWILVYQNQSDPTKAKKVTDFLTWALTKGQATATAQHYAPLPPAMAAQVIERLKTITVGRR
jgi:phosphate transport system substrate-binding protein